MKLEARLLESLENLKKKAGFRSLVNHSVLSDFSSNDYLGFARSSELKERVAEMYSPISMSGAGGSRLLSGNHPEMEALEVQLCSFHKAEAALLINSGYDANLSIYSSIPKRGDIVVYDSLVHASIHDGMRMGKAETVSFKHNDPQDLKKLLENCPKDKGQIFVAVESLYSMDGDIAPLAEIVDICDAYEAALIVDEAHATGVLGQNGRGLVQELGLENRVFARLHTFGKAIGGHGAAVLGSNVLRDFLINFARPLIFSTALSLHDVVHAAQAYEMLSEYGENMRLALKQKIQFFRNEIEQISDRYRVLDSQSPIQGIIIPGNDAVVKMAQKLQQSGFDIRPIRYPTVAAGSERLRICLHLFNTEEEIDNMIGILKND